MIFIDEQYLAKYGVVYFITDLLELFLATMAANGKF